MDCFPFYVALLVFLLYFPFYGFHVFSYPFAIFPHTHIFMLPSHWKLELSSFARIFLCFHIIESWSCCRHSHVYFYVFISLEVKVVVIRKCKKKEKFDWIEKLERHLIFKSYK